MAPIKDLDTLIRCMKPERMDGKYYFATVDASDMMSLLSYLQDIVCVFREGEGLTLIFSEDIREEMKGMSEKSIEGPFAMITLQVESNLHAVGFLARITEALAKEGIAVNAVSAYTHNHLFVDYAKAEKAVSALEKLSGL